MKRGVRNCMYSVRLIQYIQSAPPNEEFIHEEFRHSVGRTPADKSYITVTKINCKLNLQTNSLHNIRLTILIFKVKSINR